MRIKKSKIFFKILGSINKGFLMAQTINLIVSQCCNKKCEINPKRMVYICTNCNKKCLIKKEKS